ncbi:MAG: hypothetical protein ABH817_02355 [archaeon]
MERIIKRAINLGFGMAFLTSEKINSLMKEVKRQYKLDDSESRKLAKKLKEKARKIHSESKGIAEKHLAIIFKELGLVTKKDLTKTKKKR